VCSRGAEEGRTIFSSAMPPGPSSVQVSSGAERPVEDKDIESLLRRVYVEEGFTRPDVAATAFLASAVRARGEILCAWAIDNPKPAGMVIFVPPTSSACKIARSNEAEMHLLAVDESYRSQGIGRLLVETCERTAYRAGWQHMVLWTQPTMLAAQRLYAACGFTRAPARDAAITALGGRTFLVYREAPRSLTAGRSR
jgi:ribosomal protein S18 acetylase RimI-like enzyme